MRLGLWSRDVSSFQHIVIVLLRCCICLLWAHTFIQRRSVIAAFINKLSFLVTMYLLLIFDVPLCGKFMWGLVPEKSHLSVPKHCIGKRHLKCHIHVRIITRKARRQNIPKEKGVTQFSTQWTKVNKNDITHLDLMKLRVQDCDNHYYCQQRQWLVFFLVWPESWAWQGKVGRGERRRRNLVCPAKGILATQHNSFSTTGDKGDQVLTLPPQILSHHEQ